MPDIDEMVPENSTPLEPSQTLMHPVQIVNIKDKKFIVYGVDLETLPQDVQEKLLQAEKDALAEAENAAKKRKL